MPLHGYGATVSTGTANATITEDLGGTLFKVGATGNEVINAFGYNKSSVVELLGGAGGYADAYAPYQAVHDAHSATPGSAWAAQASCCSRASTRAR